MPITVSMMLSNFEVLVHEVKYFLDRLIIRPAYCRKSHQVTDIMMMPPQVR